MSLVIKLKNIVSPCVSGFTVSYKEGITPYPLENGFTPYNGTYSVGTTSVNVSGITINFNSTYWFKITDVCTGRYIIENIETNDPIAYTNCCPQPEGISAICVAIPCNPPENVSAICSDGVTPTPTPTATPTPTPTPTATATPTPTPTATLESCLTGDVSSTGNCSGGETASFTLASGYQATITPNGYFYSGTGTRYAYAYLRTNTGTNIQQFTMTQVNSNSPTFSPSTYTLNTAGSYQLYVQQVDCNQGGIGGSGIMSLAVGDCIVYDPPTPTPTTTPTPTPSCEDCYQYEISNYYGESVAITYTKCDGTGPYTLNIPYSINKPDIALTADCILSFDLGPYTQCGGASNCLAIEPSLTPCGNTCEPPFTPTPTVTPTATPIQTYTWYVAQEILDSDESTTYCNNFGSGGQGYVMSQPVWTSDASLSPGTTILYTDSTLTTPYTGTWSLTNVTRIAYITQLEYDTASYRTTTDPQGDGTYTGGIYKYLRLDSSGVVISTGTDSCSGGGGEE